MIDQWIFEEEKFNDSTDVGNAWHVLAEVLDGDGFCIGEPITEALSMGGFLATVEDVAEHSERLAEWTHEQVLEAMRDLDDKADLYRLGFYKRNKGLLLQELDQLKAFYKQSADEKLGIVHYIA